MRFDILTLFPDLFTPFLQQGINRRAYDSGRIQLHLWPLREHAEDNYRRVDDRPYGGGPGMVMLAEPLERALRAVRAASQNEPTRPVVHFSPTGRRMDQALMREMAAGPGAILLCGRYEGIDQRVLDRHVDLELSLGDFVLSGGELPALALLDGVARLQEGVLSDARSHLEDSFENGLLDCPHYSRPEVLVDEQGQPWPVPAVLLSGHHAAIARWRRERSLALTQARRPDLIVAARAAGLLSKADEQFLKSLA
ncbi:tRNA (guanosine(37)-N1)-methyltransferase TrmD [Ideonella livida]|uniref:tRNA (guanine-N(1)-)-methyltransferase n=1 Tax=Ideonella livida TaxID=2707176 RepID=A0A7C9TIY8_9BURK|nr:tRNA (guanosine(37)-N1)-methyltransferase TrmD [Ideonella livida]NDY91699.1 tRNA (guanosine(37)-N1)-methyltransferase TrmD [Ideonella livida]